MLPLHCTHLIFDLDGTLIDSAPSILSCFRKILDQARIAPLLPLDESLIGPPLPQTLQTLTGIRDESRIAALVDAFKDVYDSEGYRDSLPYSGVPEMLAGLQAAGHRLALATNKRILPTQLILRHLDWDGYFDSVWSLDCVQPRLADKTAMLRAILQAGSIAPAQAAYIGDKIEDGHAAQANAMRFVAARWGYGEFPDSPADWRHLDSPQQLAALFASPKE
ncbi:MAG: HAD family hydrolase [Gammaproteobacteria bacterium]|nr:HAD family hydrolase [Gammaproteobacteria bacterium]MBU1775834.1 HAD family hydrolase [Gammaproteobacteria bacterium]MBU1968446.1 HAD family hydrolase [Gammaproteobacteria bacterium]